MALNAYMAFTGQKQGTFKGNGRLKGIHARKSVLVAASFDFGVQTPTNSIVGSFAGKRRHQPITIRKEVDAASPQLFAALASKESLTSRIDLVKAGKGSQTPNYTLELSEGVISSIRRVPPATKGPTHSEGRDTHEYEEIKFTFQMIDVTWNDGGITMHDDWNAPV